VQKHVKIYFDFFDFGIDDVVPDEINNTRAVDIHHIHGRGKGKDVIENLMALNRDHHNDAHAEKLSKEVLQKIHNEYMRKWLEKRNR